MSEGIDEDVVQPVVSFLDFNTDTKFNLKDSETLQTRLTDPPALIIQWQTLARVFSAESDRPVSITTKGSFVPGRASPPSGSPEKFGRCNTM